VAEHGIESGYMHQLVKEAIEIKLHVDNTNREEGFKLSKTWNLSTRFLKYSNAHRSGESQEHKHRERHATKKMK
jgi:hypothetical protein